MSNRNIKLILLDLVVSLGSLYLAFLIRFEFNIPDHHIGTFYNWLPWFSVTQILVFHFSGLYARIWRYTSLFDLYAIISSVITACAISVIYVMVVMGSTGYPRSVLLLYLILNILATAGIRLSVRVYFTHYQNDLSMQEKVPQKMLLLIGAGRTGKEPFARK